MTVKNVGGWISGSLPDDTGREWPVVQHRQASARGPLRDPKPNLILHTTETSGYIEQLKFPSQWQCGEGKIGQHIQLGLAGDAVNDHDLVAQQIEMVARVGGPPPKLGPWLPEEATLGPTVALVAWLHKSNLIKTGLKRPTNWPVEVDRTPAAVESYYRRKAGLWPNTPGVYGHIEIPGNSHWDPGGFNYPKFFERVQNAVGGEDMSTQDMRDGATLQRTGKKLPANANADMKYGYNLEERIEAASKTPKPIPPGTPGLHDHNDRYATVKHPHIVTE